MLTPIAFLFGVAFIAIGLWARQMGLRCGKWPHVEGVIVDSRVDDSNLETTAPKVRYRYAVNGVEMSGWRVSYTGYATSLRSMQARIADYPPGHVVNVFYDPADPRRSVLNNQPASDWWLWFVAGATALAGSVVLAVQ